MTSDWTTSTERRVAPLSGSRTAIWLGAIGGVLLSVAAAFLYLGGWFTPGALTPARFGDRLEEVGGIHPGFRRNHAKRVGVSGIFESDGQGTRLSKAIVFRTGRVP